MVGWKLSHQNRNHKYPLYTHKYKNTQTLIDVKWKCKSYFTVHTPWQAPPYFIVQLLHSLFTTPLTGCCGQGGDTMEGWGGEVQLGGQGCTPNHWTSLLILRVWGGGRAGWYRDCSPPYSSPPCCCYFSSSFLLFGLADWFCIWASVNQHQQKKVNRRTGTTKR